MKIVYFIFILLSIGFLSNSSLHPSGNTGAPGDSFCGGCHTGSGGALDGEISISGFPTTVAPSTTYSLTITTTNPAINATRAGFQILVLDAGDMNIGTFSNNPADTQIRMQSGRFYLGHKPAKFFSGAASVSWTTDWTSPSAGSGAVTIYGASVIANGSGGNSGDRAVLTNESGIFQGGGGGTPLAISVTEDSPTSCSDSADGKATANPTGGTPPYNYNWDNGETTMQAINLTPGTHDVTVTDGVNSTISDQVFINSPTPVVGMIVSQGDALCNGQNTGFANLSASGGTPSYTYNWSDGGSGASRNDLLAGNYTATISDGNLCETTINLTINEPTLLSVSETITKVSCNGGSDGMISVTPSGGSGSGYTYQWSNGSSDQNQSNLVAGPYSLTLFDSNNCSKSFPFDVGEPPVLNITTVNMSDALCNGASNGTAEVSGNGGIAPYTYTWSDGGSGPIRNDLIAGTYTVNIIDDNSCGNSTILTIGQPALIAIDSVSSLSASCPGINDGSLTINASGGAGNFSYLWSNGDIGPTATNLASGLHSIVVTDNNNCTNEASFTLGALTSAILVQTNSTPPSCNGGNDGSATVQISNGSGYDIVWSTGAIGETVNDLEAGIYTVQANSGSGCVSNEVSITITEPNLINIPTSSTTNPLCFGSSNGAITIEGSGGSGNLTYAWSNGMNGTTISDLTSGEYSVIISDENQCTSFDTFNLIDPNIITIDSVNTVEILCTSQNNGSLQAFGSGGSGSLSYVWSNGSTDALADNLISGEYTVMISDTNSCSFVDTFFIDEPAPIVVDSAQVTDVNCNGEANGSVEIFASGGTGVLSYLWENGDITATSSNLPAGTYSVNITDTNGCIDSSEIIIIEPDTINASATIINESEVGENDGSIKIIPNGGTPGYTYNWSNGGSTDSIGGLEPGVYSVIITDINGCSITKSYNISSGDCLLAAAFTTIDVSCFGYNDGQIIVDVTGNNGLFTFEITPPNGTLDSLPPGIYQVLITDDNLCTFLLSDIEIIEPTMLNLNIDQVIDANTTNNGSIDVTTIGGTPGYSYSWVDIDGLVVGENEDLSDIGAGFYVLNISDANGCLISTSPIEVKFISGTNDFDIKVSIAPNPVSDLLYINHSQIINQISLYTLSGKLVKSSSPKATKFEVLTDRFEPGIYIIEIVSKDSKSRHKIVIL